MRDDVEAVEADHTVGTGEHGSRVVAAVAFEDAQEFFVVVLVPVAERPVLVRVCVKLDDFWQQARRTLHRHARP